MISRLAAIPFVTETYMQSLGHRQGKGLDMALDERSDSVIDDLYFLDRVDFGREYGDTPIERVLLGEHPWTRRCSYKYRRSRTHLSGWFPLNVICRLVRL